MANIKDIAEHTGLSVATISRVFNNSPLVKPKTKKKVLAAAKKLDYQHNISAAGLRSGISKIIGVVVPEISNVFFAVIINGIEKRLKDWGYSIIIAQSHESEEKENEVLSSFQRLNVDGVLISTAKETKNFQQASKMMGQKIPFVFFDRIPSLDNINSVTLDDYKGAVMATKHLLEAGCKNIVHIAGESNVSIFGRRIEGFQDALNDAGIDTHEDSIIELSEDQNANLKLIKELFRKRPDVDGFFAHGDFHALYIIDVLKELDVPVPGQVKVMGFGNADFSAHVTPSLSTIDQNCVQMGQIAATTLIGQLQSDEAIFSQQILTPQLVVRKSTATS